MLRVQVRDGNATPGSHVTGKRKWRVLFPPASRTFSNSDGVIPTWGAGRGAPLTPSRSISVSPLPQDKSWKGIPPLITYHLCIY